MTKEIYNPKEHQRADEALHKADLEEDKPEPKTKGKAKAKAKKKREKKKRAPKINRYGFFHCDKSLAQHLGVKFGKNEEDVPVTVERIPNGFIIKIVKA